LEETEMGRFANLKNKFVELEIGGEIISVKPLVSDAEMFLALKKDIGEKEIKLISTLLTDMIARANPTDDLEDVKSFVAMHYGELLLNLAKVYGFTVREELGDKKKEDPKLT
jgi:DNA polymerase III sliding clamp (beta) subunit (PCNA family)